MNKVSKASKILDRLVARKTLSSEGLDWLKLSLDPFHDMDHPVAGYPDADCARTVVSCFQSAMDVSKPANITSATWDAHVFNLPVCGAEGFTTFKDGDLTLDGAVFAENAAAVSTFRGLVNVEANNGGASLYPKNHAEFAAATRSTQTVNISTTAFNGTMSRVIGMGIEVVDTTAEMYKQGAITCYRMPQMPGDATMAWSNGTNYAMLGSILEVHAPPSTPAEAMTLNGTRQWPAAEGAYSVCTLATVNNPMKASVPKATVIANSNYKGSSAEISFLNMLAPGAAVPAASIVTPKTVFHCPYNTSGIMLTGLNANSTFRVKVKVYVEMAPLPWQPDMAVLASPSAPYDPAALEAYSKVLQHVPVATVADDNSFGDWFAGITDILSKISLPLGTALTPLFPAAPAIGAAAAAGFGAASHIANKLQSKNVVEGQKPADRLTPAAQALRNITKLASQLSVAQSQGAAKMGKPRGFRIKLSRTARKAVRATKKA